MNTIYFGADPREPWVAGIYDCDNVWISTGDRVFVKLKGKYRRAVVVSVTPPTDHSMEGVCVDLVDRRGARTPYGYVNDAGGFTYISHWRPTVYKWRPGGR